MGRRENAVAANTRQLEALALWLQAQRQRAGLTYAAMAQRTTYDATTLSRATKGAGVPSLDVVEAFTDACDGDLSKARQLWRAARRADQKLRRKNHQATPHGHDFEDLADLVDRYTVHPQLIENFPQLRRAMVELRAKGGQPSLRELEKRAGRGEDDSLHLPKSTLGEILSGKKPPSRWHVITFAKAMGVTGATVTTWGGAWDRASRNGAAEAAHAPLRIRLLPEQPALPAPVPAGRGAGSEDDGAGPARPGPDPARPRHEPRPFEHLWEQDFVARNVDDLLRHGLLVITPGSGASGSLALVGPRRPHPPLGHTPSGLPIRRPRRYERLRRRPAPAPRPAAFESDPFTWGRPPLSEPAASPSVRMRINIPGSRTSLPRG